MAPQHPRDPVAEGVAEGEQSIRQEIAEGMTEDAKGRPQVARSALDRDQVRTRRREIVERLKKIRLAVQALQWRLLVYIGLIELGYDFVEKAVAEHARTRPAQQFYSPETRDAQRDAFEAFGANRRRVQRLGTSELAKAVKQACSVNVTVTATDPAIEFYDRCTAMLEALAETKHAKLFKQRDVDPEILIARLKPKVAKLKAELDKGVSIDLKRGEASEEIYWSLLFLDIAFERTLGFLSDLELVKEAEGLRARIPRRHEGRRATDAKQEPEPESGDGAETPDDKSEPPEEEKPVVEEAASEPDEEAPEAAEKKPVPAKKAADPKKNGGKDGKGAADAKEAKGGKDPKPGKGAADPKGAKEGTAGKPGNGAPPAKPKGAPPAGKGKGTPPAAKGKGKGTPPAAKGKGKGAPPPAEEDAAEEPADEEVEEPAEA